MMFTGGNTMAANASFTSPLFTVYEHPLEARRWKRRKESMARGRRTRCDLYVRMVDRRRGDKTKARRGNGAWERKGKERKRKRTEGQAIETTEAGWKLEPWTMTEAAPLSLHLESRGRRHRTATTSEAQKVEPHSS